MVALLSIIWDDQHANSYAGVQVRLDDASPLIFNTGDPAQDWASACRSADEAVVVMLSSSCDDFVWASPDLTWDEDENIVRRAGHEG